MTKILESANAIAALVGAIAASLVAVIGEGSQAAQIVAIVIAVCTGIATYAVPNTTDVG